MTDTEIIKILARLQARGEPGAAQARAFVEGRWLPQPDWDAICRARSGGGAEVLHRRSQGRGQGGAGNGGRRGRSGAGESRGDTVTARRFVTWLACLVPLAYVVGRILGMMI